MRPISPDVTLSIGEVSELLGVSPGIIRFWEREKLIAPHRTAGGHRVFSNADLRRLRRIAKLYLVDVLNPAGIRRELGQVAAVSKERQIDPTLGPKLRQLRKAKKMTLALVAEKSRLSPSFISALERGNTGVGLETLFRLAEALGTTIPSIKGASRESDAKRHFVAADARQEFKTDDGGIVLEDLIPKPAGMESQIATIAPGASSEDEYSHKGQEFLFVLEGRLSFWLEPGETYDLAAGDSLYLHSHLKHRWANETDAPTRVLWVNAALPVKAGVPAPVTDAQDGEIPREPFSAVVGK